MSKKYEVSPILIKDKGKVYRILNIIYSSDNSIYFSFPSNKKRRILTYNEEKFNKENYTESLRNLIEFENENEEPKVSFHAPNSEHPDSMVVHINSNKIGKIIPTRDVLDVGDNKEVFIYLLQIIIPNDLSFFDEYNNKHNKYIEIDNSKLDNETLSLEFIIHSNNINTEEYYLPYSKNRNFRCAKTFITSNKLTCSVVISTLRNSINNVNDSLLLSINTKDTNGLYAIVNE